MFSPQDFRLATRIIVQRHFFKDLPYKMVKYFLMFISMIKDKKKKIRPIKIYKAWLIERYSLEG